MDKLGILLAVFLWKEVWHETLQALEYSGPAIIKYLLSKKSLKTSM